ncbi:MAG: diguanylate cyclase domain-containing protein [Pseudomonadales bacterium]
MVAGSMGISLYPYTARDADELKKQADIAMYAAKRSERAWQLYNSQTILPG